MSVFRAATTPTICCCCCLWAAAACCSASESCLVLEAAESVEEIISVMIIFRPTRTVPITDAHIRLCTAVLSEYTPAVAIEVLTPRDFRILSAAMPEVLHSHVLAVVNF